MSDPELCLDGSERDILDHLMDAIDAACNQDTRTWLTNGAGERIAAIVTVEDAELLNRVQDAVLRPRATPITSAPSIRRGLDRHHEPRRPL